MVAVKVVVIASIKLDIVKAPSINLNLLTNNIYQTAYKADDNIKKKKRSKIYNRFRQKKIRDLDNIPGNSSKKSCDSINKT
ncbi:MAG: hypothetical protein IKM61_05965 [Eubacteriaceae bacterium]|nr:hypothetical protein [Eubacteriaceae bacterium]